MYRLADLVNSVLLCIMAFEIVPAYAAQTTKATGVIKGRAEIGYTQPQIKRENNVLITKIAVKNLSAGLVDRLQIEEFWYDKSGNVVTSSVGVINGSLHPGETGTVTIETAYLPAFDKNNYRFSHANGDVKPTLLKSIQGREGTTSPKAATKGVQ